MTRSLAFLGVLLCLAACSDQGSKPADGNGDGTVSFAGDVQPIFTASCASGSCHGGAAPALGLTLASGASYAAIVERPSLQRPQLLLVHPGQPDSSYLYLKVVGAAGIDGARMPIGGALSAASTETLRDWIARGAPSN
ncbi:MAG: hypothetical protein FJY75_03895 [Candidatus Eisenbacteria bacterium]|uniref:Cytochrome C Planctomycete-type domain-containing protein n=1 Tax=Eiseniibacteriota bacterium TaxID=2212470 RepID=A0A937XAN9_UNCEI|nr:hypothetical protein [Candidatus Eisenbacteria bacterium]